jgi:hypothetical protein
MPFFELHMNWAATCRIFTIVKFLFGFLNVSGLPGFVDSGFGWTIESENGKKLHSDRPDLTHWSYYGVAGN